MNSREITLWIDGRWYDALSRYLKDETVEDKLNDYLDELANQLPFHEYERISAEIWQEDQQAKLEEAASRVFSVFHIRENGEDRFLQLEWDLEFLGAARLLRSCLRAGGGAVEYEKLLCRPEEITAEQFQQMAVKRMENTGKVTGAFNLDFDRQQFSALHIMDGWKVYRMKNVSTAAYHAYRKSFSSEQEQWSRFLNKLNGKELTHDIPEVVLRGQRPLNAADISFSDEIMQNDNLLEFYMDVTFDPDKVFGTHVCTAENDNYLNLYASYDMESGQVCDALTVILVRNDGEAELTYPLSEAERTAVQFKMDEYCQQRLGHGLAECRQEYLVEEQAAQEELTQGPALTL